MMWQGKWFDYNGLVNICGLGSVKGLCGANCRHSYYPVVPGISEPTYSAEQLEQMNAQENQPKEYLGKQYTTYEATQRQRYLETTMRAQRQKIRLLEEAGADEDDIINARCRYHGTSQEYTHFSKVMNLPQQRQRVAVDGLGDIGIGKYIKTNESGKSGKHINSTSENNVDLIYINSKEYRKKFVGITGKYKIDSIIYSQAKAQLTHCNGTYREDMTLINSETGEIVGRQSNSISENGVDYNHSLNKAIKSNPPYSLISVHNHPTNNPPTGSDIVSNGGHKYKIGVVATHNGKVFIYKAGNKPFSANIFANTVDKFRENEYNEYNAIKQTLKLYEEEYGIEWSEL